MENQLLQEGETDRSRETWTGLIFGIVTVALYGRLVNYLEAYSLLIIFGSPIIAGFAFPRLFPETFGTADKWTIAGIFMAVLAVAFSLFSKGDYGVVVAIIMVIFSPIYLAIYAAIIFIVHRIPGVKKV